MSETGNHLAPPPPPPASPCPECGAPRSVTASPTPWPIRRRLLIQLAAIALALGFWAYKMAETWPTLPAATTYGPGVASAEFPPERFTRADLEAYARGERADGRLLAVFDLEVYDTAVGIEAALIPPAGSATSGVTSYGWPYPIYSWRNSASYSDVYTLANPTSGAPRLVDAWFGWAHVRVRVDEVGRIERSAFYPERVVSSAVVVFAAWLAARIILIALSKLAPHRTNWRRLRLWIPLAVALVAAIVVVTLSLVPRTSTPAARWPLNATAPTADTGFTFADIIALRSAPDGETRLAAAVLDAATAASIAATAAPVAGAEAPHDVEPVFVYGWRQDRQIESAHAGGGWPMGLNIQSSSATPLRNADDRDRLRYKLSLDRDSVALIRHNPVDPVERTTWRYSLAALAKVAFALLLIWYTIAGAIAIWRRLLRRRDRRRARAGRCIACGYDLG